MSGPTSVEDPSLPRGAAIIAFQRACLARPGWPEDAAPADTSRAEGSGEGADARQAATPWTWIERNHRFNSLLWAQEDLARRTQVSADEIAANKRAIDGFNQARNDATERLDEVLLIALGLVDADSAATDVPVSTAAPGARLNSETAGAMIDRLSILCLKVDAMNRQTQRDDVDESHRVSSRARLERLIEQRDDLARCFDELLADSLAGRAYFKVYRQFKMYNDPRFNPALVAERRSGG
jgi:hypothetical protein